MNAAPHTPPAEPAPAPFDADFMRKLETLHLLARKLFRGQSQNDRTTLRFGMGLEFADQIVTDPNTCMWHATTESQSSGWTR